MNKQMKNEACCEPLPQTARCDSATPSPASQDFVCEFASGLSALRDAQTTGDGASLFSETDEGARAAALEACDFSFAYTSDAAGIGPIDWRVPEGSFSLLVGNTGSGKTTLLKSFKPAIAPHGDARGELRVFGAPVAQLSNLEAACSVGYVAQSPENQIVCDTVWHELAFGLENIGCDQNLMRRRIAEVAHFFGIEPWFRRSVDELSGGQKQIVTLAATLALRPRVLLLDEPTSQLDPVAEKNFLHALFRVNRELGITVVVATHAPEAMAAYATNAVCLRDGVLCEVSLTSLTCDFLHFEEGAEISDVAAAAENAIGTKSEAVAQSGVVENTSISQCEASQKKPALKNAAQASMSSSTKNAPVTQAPVTQAPVVRARDLYVRYGRTGDWVLRGLDLSVAQGEIQALVGGNGCGKSTLLKAIAGTLKPERGSMRNIARASQALLPQNPKALFVCDTVAEELAEWQKACGYADEDIAREAASAGLTERLQNHPYDLSGGQQQLLALAKLLLTKPKLLLLDEPTKGLDAQAKLEVARMLRGLAAAGTTIVMATHDLPFAALVANTATMLFDGEDAATQPAHAFFANNLFYRPANDAFAQLWQAQGCETVDGGQTQPGETPADGGQAQSCESPSDDNRAQGRVGRL